MDEISFFKQTLPQEEPAIPTPCRVVTVRENSPVLSRVAAVIRPRPPASYPPKSNQEYVEIQCPREHGYFGPGTPQTMKIARCLSIIWPSSAMMRYNLRI